VQCRRLNENEKRDEIAETEKMFHVEFMRKYERENVRDFMRIANFHMDMRSCKIAEFTL
jgi:hypothetical protein